MRPVGVANGQSGPGWESESSQGPASMMTTGQRAGVSGSWAGGPDRAWGPRLGGGARRRGHVTQGQSKVMAESVGTDVGTASDGVTLHHQISTVDLQRLHV